MAGQLQDYTVDQAAGAIALTLGALGSLLLVIWQSRCLCRCRIGFSDQCYIFDCQREPPPDVEKGEENDPDGAQPEKTEKTEKPEKTEKKDETLIPTEPEPEPEPEP